jgi:hypothetical protein
MKHLMTLMALVVAVTAGAQGTTIHEYPWNPDSNNDNLIGVDDLLDFLPVFGDEFGNPPEPCDYDGSTFEEFVFSIMNGTIILDSVFVEYEIEDASTYYLQGCPEPVTDTVVFAGYSMLDNIYLNLNSQFSASSASLGFSCNFNGANGFYHWEFFNSTLFSSGFIQDGFFSSHNSTTAVVIPFPPAWYLDEDGIHFDCCWNNGWISHANYLHILPYWHYAE